MCKSATIFELTIPFHVIFTKLNLKSLLLRKFLIVRVHAMAPFCTFSPLEVSAWCAFSIFIG